MKSNPLRLTGVALILAGLILLGLSSGKTVTLWVDGKTETLTSSAFTVGELLRKLNLPLSAGDRLTPSPEHWLRDGEQIRLEHSALFSISADGKSYQLATTAQLPANVLALAGVPLFPGDRILVDGQPAKPGTALGYGSRMHSLQVVRAAPVELVEESARRIFYSSAPTIGEALFEAGVTLRIADRLAPPAGARLPLGSLHSAPFQVRLTRSRPVTITLKERQIRIRSAAQTVGEALAEAGVALQGLDYSQPPAGDPLPAGGGIRVVRVQESLVQEQKPLAFETKTQPAPDVELDSRKVIQPGEFGLSVRSVRIRYEDGVEVSRTLQDEWIARQPKPRILGYGTKVVVRTLNTPSGPVEYWRAVPMYATSYSPCRIFKDHCDSYTASGATLQKGVVAMTGAWYRYHGGDRIYVPDYGVGTVADTGGGVPGRYWIDLGYSEKDYVSWHQMVTVYFLTPVPANIMWVLP